jgi:hypothetical protein
MYPATTGAAAPDLSLKKIRRFQKPTELHNYTSGLRPTPHVYIPVEAQSISSKHGLGKVIHGQRR